MSLVFREAAEATQKDVSYNPVHLTQHMAHLLQMATFVSTAMKELEETKDALQFAATHDSLSGLFNRGAMEKYLAQCIKNNAEIGMPLSAIISTSIISRRSMIPTATPSAMPSSAPLPIS